MRSLRLVGLMLGLSAGTAWGQQPPPRPNVLPDTGGLDLKLLERPWPELGHRDGSFLQGAGQIADPAQNSRGVPTTFGTGPIRPVGAWLDSPPSTGVPPSPRALPTMVAPPLASVPRGGSVRQASYTVPAAPEPVVPFNAQSVEVRYQNGHWFWIEGRRLLRDFGPNRAAAQAALEMARELRPTHYGAIGKPPALEYWLTNGHAPEGILSQRQVVPFDPDKLRVEQVNGVWLLRDPFQVLCNFGANSADAQRALAVCQRYGFNQLGLIGRPNPVMEVLLYDPNRRGIDRTSLNVQRAQPMPRQSLFLPGVGWIGELIDFDARRLEVSLRGRNAVLRVGNWELASFGMNEMDAHLAARLLQDLRVNQYCRLGASGFGFFLSYGRPPTGEPLGVHTARLRRDRLTVRAINGAWVIADGPSVVFEFGQNEIEARQALAAIQHFEFDAVCQIGHGDRTLRILVKQR